MKAGLAFHHVFAPNYPRIALQKGGNRCTRESNDTAV